MQVFDADGCHRTCGEHELEQLTQQGWRLVFMYQETYVVPCCDEVPNASRRVQYEPQTVRVNTYRNVVTTRFVLKKSDEEVVSGLLEQVKRLRENDAAMNEILAKSETELAEVKKQLAFSQTDVKSAVDRYKAEMTRSLDEQTRANKLELDLAKVRAAIGDLKYKEIVG
jgi:hypothetical protein